jgi:CopG family transcriptional regulator/antitoxin EndoAI
VGIYLLIDGGEGMADLKRIMISIPHSLLQEVDGIIAMEKRNRSEFVREAMRVYIEERKRKENRESMKRGYLEMAKINLVLAEEGLMAESELLDMVRIPLERE